MINAVTADSSSLVHNHSVWFAWTTGHYFCIWQTRGIPYQGFITSKLCCLLPHIWTYGHWKACITQCNWKCVLVLPWAWWKLPCLLQLFVFPWYKLPCLIEAALSDVATLYLPLMEVVWSVVTLHLLLMVATWSFVMFHLLLMLPAWSVVTFYLLLTVGVWSVAYSERRYSC